MKHQDLESVLTQRGLVITEPRRIVFTIIKNATQPLSPKEVLSRVSLTDRATVYRTLSTFLEMGILQRISIGEESFFEPSDLFLEHHHHAYCESCKKIETFSNKDLEKTLSKSAKKIGFALSGHEVVMLGTCEGCQRL